MVVLIFSGNAKNALKWKENFSLDKKRRFGANHGKFFWTILLLTDWFPGVNPKTFMNKNTCVDTANFLIKIDIWEPKRFYHKGTYELNMRFPYFLLK